VILLGAAVVIALVTALAPRAPSAEQEPVAREAEPAATGAAVARTEQRGDVLPQRSPEPSEAPLPAPPPSATKVPSPAPARAPRPSVPSARASASPAASATATTGTINVTARPKWALITVDGKSVGSTPVAVSDLTVGTHAVEAALLGEAPVMKKTVEVEPGKIVRVHFVFE
jgi:hypothetical protein